MQQDFSTVTFNRDHRQQSAAREAAVGLRYVIASFLLNIVVLAGAIAIAMVPGASDSNLLALALFALVFVAFACGAYGIYAMMDGLGWSGAVSGVVILAILIPYAKLVVLIVLGSLGLNLIHKAGFRFRLFGPLQPLRPGPPPLPPA